MKPGSCRGWEQDLRSLLSDHREEPSLPTYHHRKVALENVLLREKLTFTVRWNCDSAKHRVKQTQRVGRCFVPSKKKLITVWRETPQNLINEGRDTLIGL